MIESVALAQAQLRRVRGSGLGVSVTEEMLNEALEETLAELERVNAILAEAPHTEGCSVLGWPFTDKPGDCDCWKSKL